MKKIVFILLSLVIIITSSCDKEDILENSNMTNLSIYPNPTRGVFNIFFISDEIDNFEITIVDAFGKLISQETKQAFVGEYSKQLDLSTYPRGIYMVQIRTNDSFVSKRVVLQ